MRRLQWIRCKATPPIIGILNDVLTAELTAINQYFIHAKMCSNWGYERLAEHARDESIDEMKHADQIIERILFFEGVPNMQRLNPVRVGETVPEQFEVDLQLEYEAVKRLNDGIAACVAAGDNATRACSKRSSSPRTTTSTGSRPSRKPSARSAKPTTWRNSCTSNRCERSWAMSPRSLTRFNF